MDSNVVRARQIIVKARSKVKHCYFPKCHSRTIPAHSISENKLLSKIAENGYVVEMGYPDAEGMDIVNRIGKKKASTFRGFCDEHDKIFGPIDTRDYEIGDAELEFLFALRASALELLAKLASVEICNSTNEIDDDGIFKAGNEMAVKDLKQFRSIFLDALSKKRFNAIETRTIALNHAVPIVAASTIELEYSPDYEIINNILPSAYDTKMKPWFVTIFPQNDRTYCLISYFRKDRKAFTFLDNIVEETENSKEIIISNLLIQYIENFFMKPSYWNKLDYITKRKFYDYFWKTLPSNIPRSFVLDDSFNLFKKMI